MRDVLLDDLESLFAAPDLGIGVSEHCRAIFVPRDVVFDVVATNNGGLRKNGVDSIFQACPLGFRLPQDLINRRSNRSDRVMVLRDIALR